MLVVVPNYIWDAIEAKLDMAIALHPEAENDREYLRSQLITYVDKYGTIPEFTLAPPNPEG